MDIVESVTERVLYLIQKALGILAKPVLGIPWEVLAVIGFLGGGLWLIGGRVARVAKPDRPYISPILRIAGALGRKVGVVLTLVWVGWLATFLLAIFLHYFVSGFAPFDAAYSAWAELWSFGYGHLIALFGGSACSAVFSAPVIWRVIPAWERGGGLPDVTEQVKRYKKFHASNPAPYIDVSKGCFIGHDEKNVPIYIPWRKLRESHVQVLGMTGSGKGVAMSLVAYQAVLAGECLVWFDPKFDRYSPRILEAAAKRADRPFHLVNLNPSSGPQLNPLLSANAFEIEDLLVAAFDLRAKGTDGDFHRGKDEDAAAEAAQIAIETGNLSIPGLFQACASRASITDQENFWRKFKKLTRLPAVNTAGGLNLSEAIANRAVIYIIGSADNEQVKMLQKLLLVRVMQIIKARDRLAKHAPTCVILDEFKHMLSPAAFTGLGVIRDFDTHFLLAHQSIGDLRSCPGIDPAEAHGAVVDNTAIKIVYKIGDDEYAEKMSRVSGKRRTYVDNSSKHLDQNGAAVGSWKEDKVQHIDMDQLTHLPMPSDRVGQASVGVLYGVGNAKVFHVGPVPVPETYPMPTPVEADAYAASPNGSTGLI
jgi:hypothetical protein